MGKRKDIRIPFILVPHVSAILRSQGRELGVVNKKQKTDTSDEESKAKVMDLVKSSFKTPVNVQSLCCGISNEKLHDRGVNDRRWTKICQRMFSACLDKGLIPSEIMPVMPEVFYKDSLKKYITGTFLNHAKVLHSYWVFKEFNPETHPIVLYANQTNVDTDLYPEVTAYLPLNELIDYGLICTDMADIRSAPGTEGFEGVKPVCYGLFHSFHSRFNLAIGIFVNEKMEWGIRALNFDRLGNSWERSQMK